MTPAPWQVGEAGPGTHSMVLPSAPLPAPSHSALGSLAFASRQDIISSRTTELSPETEAAPLLPPAHGMEAFRLVFAGVHTNLAFPVPTPPSPHN